MGREEDYELVRGLCSGNPNIVESAFDVLYEKYKRRVFSTALRILGERAIAADVTQETFLAVLRKARKFNFRSAFSSWLYRVAVNLCIDARRKRNRRRPLSLSEPEVSTWLERDEMDRSETPGPEQAARTSELRRRVREAVARLNPKLSAVVVLRYAEGLGYEEISEVLEMPIGTVKSRLNRAHAALELDLGPKLDEYL